MSEAKHVIEKRRKYFINPILYFMFYIFALPK